MLRLNLINFNRNVNYNLSHVFNSSIYSRFISTAPGPQSVSRWIRSLIFFWVNKHSPNKIRDLHSNDNLNELCLYLSNKNNSMELQVNINRRLLDQRFDTLYQLHKLLVRDHVDLSVKHLVITLNSYTRLRVIFPGHLNDIYSISEELVDYLANKLLNHKLYPFVNINEQDVSLLMNGMSKLNIRHKVLLKYLENLLMKDQNGKLFVESFSPQGIALVMNAFQKFDWTPSPYLLISTCKFANVIARKFTLSQLLVTCHALWKLQLNESYIIPLIQHLDKMISSGEKIDLKTLSLSLYTFGKLEYFPEVSKDVIVRELDNELNRNLDIYGPERENLLTNVVYGLSQLNWRLDRIMHKLFNLIIEMKLTTIGVATTLVSLCRLDYKDLVSAIRHIEIANRSHGRDRYRNFLALLFRRIDFTMQLAKCRDFNPESSPSLITGKQLLNAIFAFILSDNRNLALYNYMLSNSAAIFPNGLNQKGVTQLGSILMFFVTDDSILSGLTLESLRYLNRAIKILDEGKNVNDSKNNIKSSKTHLSICSATRKVARQLYNEANVFVEYKNIPYTIDIVIL